MEAFMSRNGNLLTRLLALSLLVGASTLWAWPAAAATPTVNGPWQLVRSDDQIIVHRRQVAGSKLHEFRGVGVVEAPIAAVIGVLDDSERRVEWMKEAVANRRIERTGTYDEIFYSRTGAPWPVADRDAVVSGHTIFDTAAHEVRIEFRSVTHAAWPPQKGVVRMPSLTGHWSMRPEHGGAWTRIEYQLHAEPGGMLPDWIVNLVSKKIPHDTIVGLRQQLRRRQYPEVQHQVEMDPAYQSVITAGDATAAVSR
jgi:hypothetical protein